MQKFSDNRTGPSNGCRGSDRHANRMAVFHASAVLGV
jgi:hypothetical protein